MLKLCSVVEISFIVVTGTELMVVIYAPRNSLLHLGILAAGVPIRQSFSLVGFALHM